MDPYIVVLLINTGSGNVLFFKENTHAYGCLYNIYLSQVGLAEVMRFGFRCGNRYRGGSENH